MAAAARRHSARDRSTISRLAVRWAASAAATRACSASSRNRDASGGRRRSPRGPPRSRRRHVPWPRPSARPPARRPRKPAPNPVEHAARHHARGEGRGAARIPSLTPKAVNALRQMLVHVGALPPDRVPRTAPGLAARASPPSHPRLGHLVTAAARASACRPPRCRCRCRRERSAQRHGGRPTGHANHRAGIEFLAVRPRARDDLVLLAPAIP